MNRLKFLSMLASAIIFLGALGYNVNARAEEAVGGKQFLPPQGFFCVCPMVEHSCECWI